MEEPSHNADYNRKTMLVQAGVLIFTGLTCYCMLLSANLVYSIIASVVGIFMIAFGVLGCFAGFNYNRKTTRAYFLSLIFMFVVQIILFFGFLTIQSEDNQETIVIVFGLIALGSTIIFIIWSAAVAYKFIEAIDQHLFGVSKIFIGQPVRSRYPNTKIYTNPEVSNTIITI